MLKKVFDMLRVQNYSPRSSPSEVTGQNLAFFSRVGLERGRPRIVEVLWWIVKILFIQSQWPWPSYFKRALLRLFGAKIGTSVVLRPGIQIHFPWKLVVGDSVWIGDRTVIHNLEPVKIGNNTAIAHEVFITTGGHAIADIRFGFENSPIVVESGVWIASRAIILKGVTVGENSVVAAGSVVTKSISSNGIFAGVPAKFIRDREFKVRSGEGGY